MGQGRRAIAAVAAAIALAGCSTTTPGTPTAEPGVTTGGTSSRSAPTTSETDDSNDLAALDPCGLMTPTARAELGISNSGTADELPSGKGCEWEAKPSGLDGHFLFGAVVYPKLSVDKVDSSEGKTETTIGGRRAVRSTGAAGSVYAVSLEVTPSSRVDVEFIGGGGRVPAEQMWSWVEKWANLVEPELP
ncbi:DUF3558 domain-containing protein [Actinokineospora pegani]|uniref:DUF3558 domain-containing protein n=1 Tax=Actinokineospora pegani TaxID=2654637 RepID=UPI001F3AFA4F|nr:DUF3558 domain-containing protein [Actinokineospora pegani]